MPSYPRVLFITSHAFNHMSGGGITFSNLFRGWAADCLATAHNDPEPVSSDVCSRYYKLSHDELDLSFPFNQLSRSRRETTHERIDGSPPMFGATRGSIIRQLALAVLGDRFPERAALTPALESWIADFNPDLLYTILGTGGLMNLIEAVRTRFDLPLVVHVMDDWMNTPGKGLLGRPEMRRMKRQAEQFFDVAALRLGISPAMCDAYENRYGVPFQAFQNTVDVSKWSSLARPENTVGNPADILYVGSIFPTAQLSSLIDACHAVAQLNEEGNAATLTIASPAAQAGRYHNLLAVHPSVRIVDTITDDQTFFERIAAADMLLLPVNFDDDTRTYIRYSMPTKIPAYLTSGTPILAYGPSGIAQIDYARDADWALIVDQPGIEGLKNGMRELLENTVMRQRLSMNATQCAAHNHDSSVVRRDFQAALCDAAENDHRKEVS